MLIMKQTLGYDSKILSNYIYKKKSAKNITKSSTMLYIDRMYRQIVIIIYNEGCPHSFPIIREANMPQNIERAYSYIYYI